MLDLVEVALENAGIGFGRLDGSMNLKQRSAVLKSFREDGSRQVLLASIQCAGVGCVVIAFS